MPDQNTGVLYDLPHPTWGQGTGPQAEYERWVFGWVSWGVNLVAGVFRNDAVPVARIEVTQGRVPNTLADGVPTGRGTGRVRLDVQAIHGGGYDPVCIAAHEFVHSLGILDHLWGDPLMDPHARLARDPWRGEFSPEFLSRMAGLGFRYTGPAWRVTPELVVRAAVAAGGVPIGCGCGVGG